MYRMYVSYSGFHYAFDSWVKWDAYGLSIFSEECKLWYFVHHIMTVFMTKNTCMMDHFTWFIIGPGAYHTVMVAYPKFKYNNYIYAVTIICAFYNMIF